MRIGLDIDNVIADFDKEVLKELEKEDANKRNKGIINPNERYVSFFFDWSIEEIREFYAKKLINSKCKVVYIPNVIDSIPERVAPLKEKRLISVGRLSPEKGWSQIISNNK